MIGLLRGLSLLVNFAVPFVVAWLCGAGAWGGVTAGLAFLLTCTWLCRRGPRAPAADEGVTKAAARAAERMGAPAPVHVRALPDWTAGAVAVRGGYGLYIGAEVEPQHREVVCAHEIAHYVAGDLAWEGCTDGPARLLLELGHRVPPLMVIAVPFLLFGAPLARITELNADRLATDAYPQFPDLLDEVGAKMGVRPTVLYPSLRVRIRSARRLR